MVDLDLDVDGWVAGYQENAHIVCARLWASPLPFNEIPDQCLFCLGHHGDSAPPSVCILISLADRHVPGTRTQVPHNFSQE